MVATGCVAVGGGIIAVLTAPVSIPVFIGVSAATTATSCIVYKTGDTLDEAKKTAKDAQETMAHVREKASSAEECFKTCCTIITIAVCSFVICACGLCGYLAKNY